MDDIKHLMVALGFTDYSRGIFAYAAQLAKHLDAFLTVASIIDSRDVEAIQKITSMGYDIHGDHYVEGIRKERALLLDQYLKENAFPAEKIKAVFRVGHPVDELLRITLEENIDLVVIGLKSHSGIEHLFTGSVAEKMSRRCPVPILVYRDEAQSQKLKKRIAGRIAG